MEVAGDLWGRVSSAGGDIPFLEWKIANGGIGIAWFLFLKCVLLCCIAGVVFGLIYAGLRRLGVLQGAFWKWLVFSFILNLVSHFVYAQAERVGVDWLWFSKQWVFYCIVGFVLGVVLCVAQVAARGYGVYVGRVFEGRGVLLPCGFLPLGCLGRSGKPRC
ncbi:hypothetical protein [Bartonella gliris]|uniref:hypothetical protein n=1 Tax=Bartonella gliris TaxID=3004109 RepID=UPI00387303B2